MTTTSHTSETSRTASAIAARHRETAAMLDRIRAALHRMDRTGVKITTAAVARHAEVSRTFLYQNPEARLLVSEAIAGATNDRARQRVDQASHVEATWRERALNAEAALSLAHQEIVIQRNTIARLLGKVRDLENDLPEDGIQRVLTENTTLKQQVRTLTQELQRSQERLHGARDNNRFLDKRVADLEAELLTAGTG